MSTTTLPMPLPVLLPLKSSPVLKVTDRLSVTFILGDVPLTEAGGKIPKWMPRSRRGQYMGTSPVHAETIALVRNLKTGYISPQYHTVFDDSFESSAFTENMLGFLVLPVLAFQR